MPATELPAGAGANVAHAHMPAGTASCRHWRRGALCTSAKRAALAPWLDFELGSPCCQALLSTACKPSAKPALAWGVLQLTGSRMRVTWQCAVCQHLELHAETVLALVLPSCTTLLLPFTSKLARVVKQRAWAAGRTRCQQAVPAPRRTHLLCPAAQAHQPGSYSPVLQRLQGVQVALLCSCNLVVQQLESRGLPCSALLSYTRC